MSDTSIKGRAGMEVVKLLAREAVRAGRLKQLKSSAGVGGL